MKYALLFVATLLLSSCAIGPNYKRPQLAVPGQYRGAAAPSSPQSLADTSSFDLFGDEALTGLLKTALRENSDIQMAAERVLEARAQYGVARSGQFPTLDASGQFAATRSSSIGASTFVPKNLDLASSYTQVGFSLGWELDV